MLLHLVLVAVRAAGVATPKAVLAELVVVALLASVAEAHHALTTAVGALHGVEDLWRERRAAGKGEEGQRHRSSGGQLMQRKTQSNTKAKLETNLEPKNLNCLLFINIVRRNDKVPVRVYTKN